MAKFSFRYPTGPERSFKIVQLGRPKGRPDYFGAGLACPATPLATPLAAKASVSLAMKTGLFDVVHISIIITAE